MIVRKIVESKNIQQILTVKPGDTVMVAAEILSKNRIGAVVVSSDGKTLEGILSERDIVKTIGVAGAGCLQQAVSTLMTSKVMHCALDDTSESVMERMTEGRFRHMPVMEEGEMVALISIGDVVKARISEIESENSALTGMISNSW
ncbi:CBS domain-containing protein [Rhodobacteraceae bacterium DSL-40]|uniref:CBS domain-containing protein n=1 Tax=Amaricoccus sp. B4 TaxID=3368557 RepID=UPI000DADAF2E